jgi:drug/metabolite transporter (DMT)-like permease
MWESLLALVVRIFSNPAANVFQKKLSDKYSAILINLYSYAFLTLFCASPILTNNWGQYDAGYWLYVGLAGMLCTLGSVCLIKALQYGEMSVLGPINSYKCLVGLVVGFVVLGEVPSVFGLLGVILILFGSWFIFDTMPEGFSFKLLLRKDIILRFCALFFTGCEAVVLKKIILMSSACECFMLWCLSGLVFTLILAALFRVKIEMLPKKDLSQTFLIALCLGLMQYSTNIVFKHLNVGLSLALFQLSSVIAVLAGYYMFREGSLVKKLTGTFVMIFGSCLILLF